MAIESIKSNDLSSYKPASKVSVSAASTEQSIKVSGSENSKRISTQGSGAEESKEHLSRDISPEKVQKAISDINNKIKSTKTACTFNYHEETHRISITVKDMDTQEIIKEIPPEKTLDMIAKVWELAGILVDEKR